MPGLSLVGKGVLHASAGAHHSAWGISPSLVSPSR